MNKEKKNKGVRKIIDLNILSWVLGVAFYYTSIAYLLKFDFPNFFIIFLIAIVVFPPSFKLLTKKLKRFFKLNNNHRLFLIIILFLIFNTLNPNDAENKINSKVLVPDNTNTKKQAEKKEEIAYKVQRVVDGDTIKVETEKGTQTVRLIGINAPESVHPEKPVECFGIEASDKLKELLDGRYVFLKSDKTQDDKDKYSRLLRYVYRSDYLFINKWMVENGYAYEFTYKVPYHYQKDFQSAEKNAKDNKLGLWANSACDDYLAKTETINHKDCPIKGNISFTNHQKIFHSPDCQDYENTIINEDNGERWFCSEEEAIKAGWEKAKNCP